MSVSGITLQAYETDHIVINTETMPAGLLSELLRRLTVENPAYRDAVKFGRWTGSLAAELTYYKRLDGDRLAMPRGAGAILQDLCRRYRVELELRDGTVTAPAVDFAPRIRLSDAQERAVADVLAQPKGLLSAPAGSGKTVMALAIIARRRQPVLWLTHTKELANQARQRASQFLCLGPSEIGMLGAGKRTLGERLTIGMLQTLARGVPDEVRQRVGHVILDEAHHAPAQQVAATLSQLPAHFLLGLTATPYRRDGLDAVISFHLGPVTAELVDEDLAERLVQPRIFRRDTGVSPVGDSFTRIVLQLVANGRRNELIIGDVVRAVQQGRSALVLSERVDHVEYLADRLAYAGVAVGVLHGGMSKAERDAVRADLDAGQLQALVATSQLVGEGFDVPELDTLFLATPISWHGRLTQYVGRVRRTADSKDDAIVIDYCDDHPMLWASWAKRRDAYDNAGYQRKRVA